MVEGRDKPPRTLSIAARKIYRLVDALIAQGWSYLKALLHALRVYNIDPNSDAAEEAVDAMNNDHPDWITK